MTFHRFPHLEQCLYGFSKTLRTNGYTVAHRFLLFDRDSKFGDDVVSFAGGWEACHCATLSGARGKTRLRSTGWEVADATYWIT